MRQYKNCELCGRALTKDLTQKRGVCLHCASENAVVEVMKRKHWSTLKKTWIAPKVKIIDNLTLNF